MKLGVIDASKKHMSIWKEMSHYWLMKKGVFKNIMVLQKKACSAKP
jgi:hypothetical protein